MVKEGVAVIDIGITEVIDSRTGRRKLVGDVDFEGVYSYWLPIVTVYEIVHCS